MQSLKVAFREWAGEECSKVNQLPASGSERTYWRLSGQTRTAIGAYHPVSEENAAFIALTNHFLRHGMNVPEVYSFSKEKNTYLLQDLGDVTLFSLLDQDSDNPFNDRVTNLFAKSLEELIRFQVVAAEDLDYSNCYPRRSFDSQSLSWDLDYFKYDFLKLLTGFNEQKLEDDFQKLSGFLLEAPQDFFMYRDFQSRNIMVYADSLYFIDYQGGRKGPLQYDPVSLLFQVKAGMPAGIREKLLDHYLARLKETAGIDREGFMKYYEGFILLRLLQVLGAYGFRGMIQKKSHFLSSIPHALNSLRWFLDNSHLPIHLPELMGSLKKLTELERFQIVEEGNNAQLVVDVSSFAYKNGIPDDYSGHGGGFVFDCRALPNPGREESMRTFSGKDTIIIEYMRAHSEVMDFLNNVHSIVGQAIENYINRGFGHLSVSFGCTGGQHRSVYCAEMTATYLIKRFPGVAVRLNHREIKGLK